VPTKEEYWRNPEKYRAAAKAHARLRPDLRKVATKKWETKNRERRTERWRIAQRKAKRRNPIRYMLYHAKRRAEQYGLPFDLDTTDLVIPERCPVLGHTFEWGEGKRGWRNNWAPSIDRIKPELGYVRGNVQIISNRVNILKSNGSVAEFEAIIEYMKRTGANYVYEETLRMPRASAQLSLAL
jgi:hypothetical protein